MPWIFLVLPDTGKICLLSTRSDYLCLFCHTCRVQNALALWTTASLRQGALVEWNHHGIRIPVASEAGHTPMSYGKSLPQRFVLFHSDKWISEDLEAWFGKFTKWCQVSPTCRSQIPWFPLAALPRSGDTKQLQIPSLCPAQRGLRCLPLPELAVPSELPVYTELGWMAPEEGGQSEIISTACFLALLWHQALLPVRPCAKASKKKT